MAATKQCAWGTCKNDSRYQHLIVKNENGDPVHFLRFPAPKKLLQKRRQWIIACHGGNTVLCNGCKVINVFDEDDSANCLRFYTFQR